jgi:hypothetical protein
MTGPGWLSDTLAGVMIIVSGYCLARLGLSGWQRRPTDRPVDAVHVLMGIAMVGMFVPALRVTGTADWEIVFGLAVGWFGWRWLRALGAATGPGAPAHHLQHAVGCAAMVYMLAGAVSVAGHAAGSAAGAAMAGTDIPLPAFAFTFALLGFVIWSVDRISGLAPVAALAGRAGTPSGPVATLPGPVATGQAPTSGVAIASLAADAPRRLVTAGVASTHPADSASATAGAPHRLTGAGVASTHPADSASATAGAPLSLRLAACCDIVMGLSMGYVLILMH